jgi:RNA polymerase sigma-70 factor (ECF subfamily)
MPEEREEYIPTRRTLLNRLTNQADQESWKTFFDTYWKLIYRVAIGAGLTHREAEDVVQETVLSVVQTMTKFVYDPETCSFKSWLLHLTRKRISDEIRKRPRESLLEDLHPGSDNQKTPWDQLADPQGCALERLWEDEWEKNLFDAAIEKVKRSANSKQYQLFHLYVIKGLPVGQVASTLRVNVGQVYLAKHRVSQLIKKELKLLEAKQQ